MRPPTGIFGDPSNNEVYVSDGEHGNHRRVIVFDGATACSSACGAPTGNTPQDADPALPLQTVDKRGGVMRSTAVITLLFLAGLFQIPASTAGNADDGKRQWQARPGGAGPNQAAGTLWCNNCHGINAEGGFGPDLAGRGLSLEQITRAVRQPWGIMPRYPKESVSDETLANLAVWFASLPKVAEPAAWKTPRPSPNPRGPYLMTVSGCYQCHGAPMANPRRVLGGEFGAAFDFPQFTKVVYNHNEYYPQNQMGLFSRDRLTEATLQEIYQYLFVDLGLRVPVTGAITGIRTPDGNTLYSLTLTNDGEAGKGLAAEELRVAVVIPAGTKVMLATGTGYKGVQHDPAINGGTDVAVWNVPKIAAAEKQTYTLTLSGDIPATSLKGSAVSWEKPALGMASPLRADSVAVGLK
jgi:mono/diheme cytochrome c family protein